MTHNELIAKIEHFRNVPFDPLIDALRAVVELHNPIETWGTYVCGAGCSYVHNGEMEIYDYPCPTIKAIEKELQ